MSEVPPSKDVGPDPTVGAAEEDEEEEGGRAEKALGKLTSKFVSLLQQVSPALWRTLIDTLEPDLRANLYFRMPP